MQDNIIDTFKKFRDKIYHFFPFRQDATFELIDSLSSNTNATSVVELSLNSLHRRNYCSITRVLDEFYPNNNDKKTTNDALTTILTEQCAPLKNRNYFLFAVDCTPNPRIFSPTQKDRGFVYSPNTISGNKPVTIGHQYSITTFLPEKIDKSSPPWVIPLACHRVATNEKGVAIGMQQLSFCMQSHKRFKNELCVSVGDSAYSSPDCIFEVLKNPYQVHISRVRSNRVFYYPAEQGNTVTVGRKKHFGNQFKLRDKTTWTKPDEEKSFITKTVKGKEQTIEIQCWNTIIMRGMHEANVSDNPFRLVKICVYKESGKLLFKKPLWLIVSGEKRFELSLQDIFDSYRQRFDIEHFFRFGKNRLLMDKSQTPDIHHEEAWWQLSLIAYTQLYLAEKLAKNTPKPWEKYLPTFKSDKNISPTQVQKNFQNIIQAIGTPAKPPKPSKNSSGREKGDVQIKRTHYPVIIKKKTELSIAVTT